MTRSRGSVQHSALLQKYCSSAEDAGAIPENFTKDFRESDTDVVDVSLRAVQQELIVERAEIVRDILT